MADVSRTIEIIFGAVDNASGAISGIGSDINALGESVGQATEPLANMFDSVVKINGAIAALGAVALGYAYNEAVQFKSATLDLQKVLSDSEGDVSQYSGVLSELSTTYGVAGTNVVSSAADFKQSGFDISESLLLAEAALQAVKISELDAAQASESFIAILNGFGAEAKEVTRLMDSLNEISNNNAASFGELAKGMAILSPNARQLGLTMEETAGFLTPVIEVFTSGAESARGLRAAFLRLTSPTKKAREAIEALAEKTGVLIPVNGDFKETINALAIAWKGASEEEKVYLSRNIAGIEQSGKFAIVMDNFGKTVEVTSQAMNGAGSAAKELAVRMAAPEEVVNRTAVSFGALAVAIGDQYLDEATGAIDATGKLAKVFGDLIRDGGLEPLFELMRPFIQEFESDLIKIAELLPEVFDQIDYGPIQSGVESLAKAFDTLFDGVDLTTPEGLRQALQKLINVGGSFIDLTSGLVDGLRPAFEAVSGLADRFAELDEETLKSAGQLLSYGKTLNVLAEGVGGVGSAIEGMGNAIAAFAGIAALRSLTGLLGDLGGTTAGLRSLVETLSRFAGPTAALASAGAVGFGIGTGIQKGVDLAVDSLTEGEESLGTWIASLVNAEEEAKINQAVLSEVATAQSQYNDAIENGAESVSGLNENIGTTVEINEKFADTSEKAASATDLLSDRMDLANTSINSNSSAIDSNKKSLVELKKEIKESEKRGQEFTKGLIESSQAMAKLAYRSALTKTAIDQIGPSMESLGDSVKAVSDVLSTGLGALTQSRDYGEFSAILGVINREEQLQAALINEQIEQSKSLRRYYESLSSKMKSGDALITIQGDGLAPELEAFMFAVLERIQVSADSANLDFLIGGS